MFRNIRNRFLLVMLLLAVLMAVGGCTKNTAVDGKSLEDDYIAVEIEEVVEDTLGNSRGFSGKVVANEEVMIMPKISGIVERINVGLGDKVKKDTILFVLEQDDISKGVEQAQASINLARKGIEQAQNGMETAMVNYELAKEKVDKALIDLERTQELYEQGAVSKAQLEQAELAASPNQLEVAKKQVSQAEIAINQSEEQLNQVEISYGQAMDNLDNAVVKAPMDGVISVLNIKKGQIASSGQVAATLVDINSIYLQINTVESVVNRLEMGQSVSVKVPAAFKDEITSTIRYISPTADDRSNLYPVRIYLDNPDGNIRPGMNGEVNLSMDQIESTLVVRGNAVLNRDGVDLVYVLENDMAIEKVVTLGLDTGDYIEVKEGLEKGDQVIVKGQHYVEDGGKVKVVGGGK